MALNKTKTLPGSHPLIIKAREKFKYDQKFKPLRHVIANEVNTCSTYKGDYGVVGSGFDYCLETDTLYTYGSGRYVVYENGKWAEDNSENYEIY